MVLGASAVSLKAPDGWSELGILAVAFAVSFLVGKRVIGLGYALSSVFVALLAFAVVGNVAIPVAIALVAIALRIRERWRGPLPSRPDREFPIQVLVVWAGLALYTLGRYAAQPDARVAFRNTDRIMEFESAIHSYFEAEFQQFLLQYDTVVSFTNWVYSFAFLAITGAILFWLWAVDTPNYRLLRNSLGISALLAVPTLALFPVAPPRLVADSGLIDSIAVFGREHAFANEYAAVPSLHVGWMALCGFVLGRSIGGKARLDDCGELRAIDAPRHGRNRKPFLDRRRDRSRVLPRRGIRADPGREWLLRPRMGACLGDGSSARPGRRAHMGDARGKREGALFLRCRLAHC